MFVFIAPQARERERERERESRTKVVRVLVVFLLSVVYPFIALAFLPPVVLISCFLCLSAAFSRVSHQPTSPMYVGSGRCLQHLSIHTVAWLSHSSCTPINYIRSLQGSTPFSSCSCTHASFTLNWLFRRPKIFQKWSLNTYGRLWSFWRCLCLSVSYLLIWPQTSQKLSCRGPF